MRKFHGSMALQSGPAVTNADESRWRNDALPVIKRRLRQKGVTKAEMAVGETSVQLCNDGHYCRMLRVVALAG